MNNIEVLKELGLSEGESIVYLALLKLGETSVSSLTKETGQHRTTIYDFLEQLLQRGLISYNIKAGVKFYKAGDPDKLILYLKEKENMVKQILPSLKKMAVPRGDMSVEVYSGIEGFKSVLNDVIKTGKDLWAFGVDESFFERKFPLVMKSHFLKEKEKGIKEFILTSSKAKFTYKYPHIEYRSVPENFFDPTATGIYGDKVFIVVWEPFTTIMIKNKGLADSYRKHMQLLWKIAKKI